MVIGGVGMVIGGVGMVIGEVGMVIGGVGMVIGGVGMVIGGVGMVIGGQHLPLFHNIFWVMPALEISLINEKLTPGLKLLVGNVKTNGLFISQEGNVIAFISSYGPSTMF